MADKTSQKKRITKPNSTAPISHRRNIRWEAILYTLRAPHVTEKATAAEEETKYVFKVRPNANKIMIKQAIEELYGKKPTKVAIINVKRKKRRKGNLIGYRSSYKKAIISLKKGEKIDILSKKQK